MQSFSSPEHEQAAEPPTDKTRFFGTINLPSRRFVEDVPSRHQSGELCISPRPPGDSERRARAQNRLPNNEPKMERQRIHPSELPRTAGRAGLVRDDLWHGRNRHVRSDELERTMRYCRPAFIFAGHANRGNVTTIPSNGVSLSAREQHEQHGSQKPHHHGWGVASVAGNAEVERLIRRSRLRANAHLQWWHVADKARSVCGDPMPCVVERHVHGRAAAARDHPPRRRSILQPNCL